MVKRRPLRNKTFTRLYLTALTLLALLMTNGASARTFNAQSARLENGMKIIVIPKSNTPAMTSMVWYKVGAADEPQGLSGMAHYFEHLMFKGTEKLEPGEFSRTVKKLGGNDNAFTGQDFTAYFQTITPNHLERILMMEADRMVNLAPPADHFASEKKVVIEERRQRTENDPRGLFAEQLRSALFINHPYGTPVIGWMNEIEDYEWADVKTFYDTWYAPNNAILVVSGNVTMENVLPLAQKAFGDIAPKPLPKRTRTAIPPAIGKTNMTLHHEVIKQRSLMIMRLAPSYAQNKKDALSLQVLNEILSGGPTTRLYRNLVVDQKKAVSISFSYDGSTLNESTIWLSAIPADGIDLDELHRLINQEILDIIENSVTENEVKDAIQRLQDAAIFARDSIAGPAMIFGRALTTGSTINDIENWPNNIAKITAEDVQHVAETYLHPEDHWKRPPVTGHLLPLTPDAEATP